MTKLPTLLVCAGLACAVALPAHAQRRIIGVEERKEGHKEDKEEKKEGEGDAKKDSAADKKKKAAEEKARKKREAEEKKKAEEAERKRKAKEAAEEAARKAAEEAERKKKEAVERKKEEAERKEKERLEKNRAARLKSAKKTRRYSREDDELVAGATMTPGKPTKSKVLELRFDLGKQLEVAHPKYGDRMPLKGWSVVATVQEPATGKGEAKTWSYAVHPLRAPGSYGFHHTPRIDGEHTVSIEASRGDDSMSFTVPVHVGAWPPPDFEEEEANNAKAAAGRAAGSRRIIGSK